MRLTAAAAMALASLLSLGRVWAEARPDAAVWQQAWWLGAAPDASRWERPEDALAVLPRSSSAWIDKGLAHERLGEFSSAEAALLQAARADRQYQPAWTLANYYFRRGDSPDFWLWARRAAPLIPDDPRPLLALAHAIADAGTEGVLDRLGGGARLARAYLDYLIGLPDLDAAYAVAMALEAMDDPADDARIADAVRRYIDSGRRDRALPLWNARFPRLDPERGPWLANANFEHAPTGSGFEARLPLCSGVTVSWRPGQMRFALDGTQADGCVLYDQPAAVAARRRYRVRAQMEGDIPGLQWIAPGPAARVRLTYRRPLGQTRARGSILLHSLDLEPL